MQPPAEHVHWLFASGFLILGLLLLAQSIVGEEVWRRRFWRAYLFPGTLFLMGVLMWPVMTFFTSSTIHMLAHGAWAETMMLAGAAELGLVRGKLHSPLWRLCLPLAFVVSGTAFLIHEQNPWLYQRSSFLHHALGWLLLTTTTVALARAYRPRSVALGSAFALVFVTIAVLLYADRDVAPIFGQLAPSAGAPQR
jgi:hypothetical membrane protein